MKKMALITIFSIIFFFSFSTTTYAAQIIVTTRNDSGTGSLREAIAQANLLVGADTIEFSTDPGAFPEGSVNEILLRSALILIDDATTIDGDKRVRITLHNDFDPVTDRIQAFELRSSNNIIKGLQIDGFWVAINFIDGLTTTNNEIMGNVISDNAHVGVALGGPNCSDNRIIGNYIGLSPSGTAAYGYQGTGIDIYHGAHHNIVGGPNAADRNIISGNRTDPQGWGVGVMISDTRNDGPEEHGNVIQGNYIGTDYTGTAPIPNDWGGIDIGANSTGNFIRENVISGNDGKKPVGIRLNCRTYIYGNIIGLTADGTSPLPNGTGIFGMGDNIIIGGPEPNQANIIAGNRGVGQYGGDDRGIWLSGTGIRIEGNYIGTNRYGSSNLGNEVGMRLDGVAQDNQIGPNNYIWNNTAHGILLDGINATRIKITQNSIKGNGDGSPGKGIILSGGPNENIVPPEITSITAGQVIGEVHSSISDGSIVEIFRDNVDQGETYIGSTLTLDGQFTFNGFVPSCAMGGNLTATVTDTIGNTSEFSFPVESSLRLPTGVSSLVFGIIPEKVECTNITTGQHVQMEDGSTSIDCEAAGLIVNPEDKILIEIKNFTKKK